MRAGYEWHPSEQNNAETETGATVDFYSKLELQGAISLNGKNIGRTENSKASRLSDQVSESTPEEFKTAVYQLENRYCSLYEKAESSEVHPLPVDDDGNVIINPGQLYHNVASSVPIDFFGSVSSLGLLATEWFGILESEGEARFCTFLAETLEDDESLETPPALRYTNQKAKRNNIQLYFDMDNLILREIVRYDYFGWKVKKANGEEGIKEYPEELQNIYEHLILPLSPSMPPKYLMNPSLPFYYWKALPGGIPPQLINGISINVGNPRFDELIATVSKLFPKATIFTSEGKALRHGE